MKIAILALAVTIIAADISWAGESGVTYVYQVSDGLGSGDPQLARVYCHDYYAQSGFPPFSLISTPNIPPTNSPKALEDHNILSASHIFITVSTEKPWIITIDSSKASIPKRFGGTLPDLLDLASEAISKTAKEWDITDYKISRKSTATAEQAAAAMATDTHAQEPQMNEAQKHELYILLNNFPNRDKVNYLNAILRSSKAPQDELDSAKKEMAKAKERLQKIRSYFKVGTSIFDYPGILEVAYIELLPEDKPDGTVEYGYQASVRLYRGDEFERTSDFYFDFDSKGVITKIGNIIPTY